MIGPPEVSRMASAIKGSRGRQTSSTPRESKIATMRLMARNQGFTRKPSAKIMALGWRSSISMRPEIFSSSELQFSILTPCSRTCSSSRVGKRPRRSPNAKITRSTAMPSPSLSNVSLLGAAASPSNSISRTKRSAWLPMSSGTTILCRNTDVPPKGG